jgi:hypothetical protein
MNKRIYILVIVLMLTSSIFGQFIGRDHLSVSLFYLQKTELDSAKKYIDLAVEDETLNMTAKSWYYKGYIYKDLYKAREKSNKTSPLRLSSIKAFKKMLTLEGKQEFFTSASKILKYEASTLYNDAARMLDPENYKLAESNYVMFKKAMLLADSTINLKSRDVKFKLALASMLNRPSETDDEIGSAQSVLVQELYLEVLVLDENNPAANYNLAILYYNDAADVINNIDYDIDLIELDKIQDYCTETFLESLPYMLKSYNLQYKPKETLVGLSNIYYGLNDMEKSELYKKELEGMEK